MIAYFLRLVLISIIVSNSCHCQSIQESIKDDGYLKHDPKIKTENTTFGRLKVPLLRIFLAQRLYPTHLYGMQYLKM